MQITNVPALKINKLTHEQFKRAMEAGRINDNEMYLTPDDGNGAGARVGDTLTTARADLDDTWLLCNGDQVSAQDYGELAKLFPSLPTDWVTKDVYGGNSRESYIKGITYANGYWVAVGQYYDGSTYHARIAYTTDPTGIWTTKDLWSSAYNGYAPECVTYANGYWVVGGSYYDGSTTYARIAYTADTTGAWTTKELWSGTFSTVCCITYTNGYWVLGGILGGSSTYYARIAYTTDLTGTWTTKNLWSGTIAYNTCINCISYANGYWVAGGGYYDGSFRCARIAYTTNLAGTWTTNDLWNASSGSIINCITYANGYWVVGGGYYSSSKYNARIAYTTDPTGAWTIKDLWSNYNYENAVTGIANCGNYWVVCSRYYSSTMYARIAYTTDITGEWTTEDLWSDGSTNDFLYCITCADGRWVVGGGYYDGTNYYARIAYSDSGVFVLPTISDKHTYTYIKAKEE